MPTTLTPDAPGPPRIRLHADDYGSTPTATRQIADLWEEGVIGGLSVLANGDALGEGAARLAARPDLAAHLTVHLNLSEGPCSAPAADVRLLTDDEGLLRHSFRSLVSAWVRASSAERARLLAEVETEWRAQIRVVRAAVAPRALDALDGHIHVHALPFLFPVAARLAREERVPGIRVPRETFHVASPGDVARPWFAVNVVKHVVLRTLSRRATRVAAAEGLRTPDRFVGVLYTGRMTADRLRAGVRAAVRAGAHEIEASLHVGRAADGERSRWRGRDGIWADASDPHRDVERDEARAFVRESLSGVAR